MAIRATWVNTTVIEIDKDVDPYDSDTWPEEIWDQLDAVTASLIDWEVSSVSEEIGWKL
jgi:hypothetical protein